MKFNLLHAIVLAAGFTLGGYFVGNGFIKSRSFDRFVTVKGLSEREVEADLAIWPISYNINSNDLGEIENILKSQEAMIRTFLNTYGIADQEITIGPPTITDHQSYGGYAQNKFRFNGKGKLTVSTQNIEAIKKAVENLSDLLGKGIVIEQDDYSRKVQYIFSDLNSIKPDMIREATESAREAAEQFAKDSGSNIGEIRRATQGYFSMEDRDLNTPYIKKVRVVTTVQYLLME
jgi:hypothetical protein